MNQTAEKLVLATLAEDELKRLRRKKRLKLMNFQHRVLHQRPIAISAEQMEKYKGIINNLTDKEVIVPGLYVPEAKTDQTGITGLANNQTKKFEIKREGLSTASLGTTPPEQARNVV